MNNTAAVALDRQINDYLGVLNIRQKEVLLTVAKTFAGDLSENDYSDEFKTELDSRYEEYKKGRKLISESAANRRIEKIVKGKVK